MVHVNKTQPTNDDVEAFIETVDPSQREDAHALAELMHEVSGEQAVLWGKIIGFGKYRYRYASGREGEWMKLGFSSRKGQFSLYLSTNVEDFMDDLTEFGTFSYGKGCIYFKRLADIDMTVLRTVCLKAYKVAVDVDAKKVE